MKKGIAKKAKGILKLAFVPAIGIASLAFTGTSLSFTIARVGILNEIEDYVKSDAVSTYKVEQYDDLNAKYNSGEITKDEYGNELEILNNMSDEDFANKVFEYDSNYQGLVKQNNHYRLVWATTLSSGCMLIMASSILSLHGIRKKIIDSADKDFEEAEKEKRRYYEEYLNSHEV